MSRIVDIKGQRFGRLVVIRRLLLSCKSGVKWLCLCSCGTRVVVGGSELRTGNTRSCGCYKKDYLSVYPANVKHRLTKSSEYETWKKLRSRCTDQTDPRYKDYGGRGITVCDHWDHSFKAFYEDVGPRPPGLTLERVDNNKGYSPDNCVWATRTRQQRNRRNTVFVNFKGQPTPITAVMEQMGLSRYLVESQFGRVKAK